MRMIEPIRLKNYFENYGVSALSYWPDALFGTVCSLNRR